MTGSDFHGEESRNYQKEIGKIIGVVALAENPLDRVMWSHYAESHRGFVADYAHGEESLEDGFRQRAGPFGLRRRFRIRATSDYLNAKETTRTSQRFYGQSIQSGITNKNGESFNRAIKLPLV